MSANKHRQTTSLDTPSKTCKRKGCEGDVVSVFNQYRPHGPVESEMECSRCHRVSRQYTKKKPPRRHGKKVIKS